MSQQGDARGSQEDDWWRQLYDEEVAAGASGAGNDSLDAHFDSALSAMTPPPPPRSETLRLRRPTPPPPPPSWQRPSRPAPPPPPLPRRAEPAAPPPPSWDPWAAAPTFAEPALMPEQRQVQQEPAPEPYPEPAPAPEREPVQEPFAAEPAVGPAAEPAVEPAAESARVRTEPPEPPAPPSEEAPPEPAAGPAPEPEPEPAAVSASEPEPVDAPVPAPDPRVAEAYAPPPAKPWDAWTHPRSAAPPLSSPAAPTAPPPAEGWSAPHAPRPEEPRQPSPPAPPAQLPEQEAPQVPEAPEVPQNPQTLEASAPPEAPAPQALPAPFARPEAPQPAEPADAPDATDAADPPEDHAPPQAPASPYTDLVDDPAAPPSPPPPPAGSRPQAPASPYTDLVEDPAAATPLSAAPRSETLPEAPTTVHPGPVDAPAAGSPLSPPPPVSSPPPAQPPPVEPPGETAFAEGEVRWAPELPPGWVPAAEPVRAVDDAGTEVAVVGGGPPTYGPEPTAWPETDPDGLDALVPDTVLDGAAYGVMTLRTAAVRGDSARYRGQPRRDALLTARFGTGEDALLLVAMASGARGADDAHRAAQDAVRWIAGAVGRSRVRLADDLRAARRASLKSGLHRLTDRCYGRLRARGEDLGLDEGAYTASVRCLLLPADPACRIRLFFGVGEGGLFRVRDGAWQDLDLGPDEASAPFRFRATVAQPGDALLMCSAGLAEPLRGEPELAHHLAGRWGQGRAPGLAAYLADTQTRVKGYADDRTVVTVWDA